MDLVHDVLDKQMLDFLLHKMGKVDGIVLELADGRPPRVVCLEAGVPTLAARLGRRPGQWARRIARRLSPERPGSFRIPWSKVRQVDLDVHVGIDADDAPVFAVERWLRKHVITRLPLGRRGIA